MNEDEPAPKTIEVWGGFECTIARVRDTYRDQSAETGHARRIADLEAAASLGLARLRYPVLWERVAPHAPNVRDWTWCDERLGRLHDLKLPVIAGLVHHGSGPRYTHLLDPAFPGLLAEHALAVARRYPWIEDFTPVNEPLTTSRFSALYGHWYPHARDESSFLRALATQCFAIATAMAAVRQIIPCARLIQTEDLGRVFSTPRLAYQAEYENERRWLTFDLLTGRVDRQHGWYQRFLRSGVSRSGLDALADNPCPPDVIGINHYLTSDRFLDHVVDGYPQQYIGGNGKDSYADVAAVRTSLDPNQTGMMARLVETWHRYGLPIAITEVHNGSTREEQLRWLQQAWQAANRMRSAGADLRAVTVWALAGSVDWSSLLTERNGHYEAGAFDTRANPPRPTALAEAVRELARTGRCTHPLSKGPGWWQRPDRFYRVTDSRDSLVPPSQPILLTGRTGTLGQAFERICRQRGLNARLLSRDEMDISKADEVQRTINAMRPWAIINTAGFVRVAEAEAQRSRCMLENSTGPAVLADVAASHGIPLVTFSSDLVFDGLAGRPYVESDATNPLCVYGESKAEAERRVLERHSGAMVVRTSAFFGLWDRHNFASTVIARLQRGEPIKLASNCLVSPTYVPDLVHCVLDLLIDRAVGIWHVASTGSLSWYEFGLRVAHATGLRPDLLLDVPLPTPRLTTLRSERGVELPLVNPAIERCSRGLASATNRTMPSEIGTT